MAFIIQYPTYQPNVIVIIFKAIFIIQSCLLTS